MYCQMIRVISSPSSSTTGFWTLIFAMGNRAFLEVTRFRDGVMNSGYSTAAAVAEAKRPHRCADFAFRLRKCGKGTKPPRTPRRPRAGGDPYAVSPMLWMTLVTLLNHV